jgi:Helix-turn-helix domain
MVPTKGTTESEQCPNQSWRLVHPSFLDLPPPILTSRYKPFKKNIRREINHLAPRNTPHVGTKGENSQQPRCTTATEIAGEATEATVVKKLVGTKEAAEMLGTTEGTLKSWRSRGIGPSWVKLGAAVRYDVEELLSFIKRNTRLPSVRALVEDRRGTL